jgi:SRSO17 transposase
VNVLIDRVAAAVPSMGDVDLARWLERFEDMFAEVVAPAFFRREPRRRAQSCLLGLVSGLERKNGWTLAEYAGERTPDGMQRLLNAARWDEDHVRDRLVRYVAARLGDPGAVLIADEAGFEKTGTRSAGVQPPARRGRSLTARSGCSWLTRSPRAARGC